jgi:exodeoxyribonuclease V alpha subunit
MGEAREVLEGEVRRVVYRAPGGEFAVVRFQVEGRDGLTLVGALGEVEPGERLRVEGQWESHPVHGPQLRAERVFAVVPRTEEGVRRYLESLRGIGPELARRLTASFGTGALEVLEKEPWRAAQVRGMGKRRATEVAAEVERRRAEREALVFLQGLGVMPGLARRIFKAYGDATIARVRENPYRLARDVGGVGFLTADRLARALGIGEDAPARLEAGAHHALTLFADEGHVYAPRAALIERALEVLGHGDGAIGQALDALIAERTLVAEGERLYLPQLHAAEVGAARRLGLLLAAGRAAAPPLDQKEAAHLSPGQKKALATVGEAAVVLITGGPGTGKTTVTRALVSGWRRARRKVELAAPTGRAAKRLAEATGQPAQTLHRLLEWGRAAGAGPFSRNAEHPLEADLVVVDEASMLDVLLFRALVEAVRPGATLVLVGDVDQLPSVGPGRVLHDLIRSRAVPVARLTEIFRQAEGSGITENAYRILAGEVPVESERKPGDFFVLPVDEPERARELVLRVVRERIPKAFGFDPVKDVQVLTPMHRGAAGTEELNRALQAALNPAPPVEGSRFRPGDKVMQVKNDYERDVFNGDVGRVHDVGVVEGRPILWVEFDGRRIEYSGDDVDALELAYAMSVHKSQGSEYPAVVLVLLAQHFLLLRRNLVYTAVTRGKRLVVLVCAPRALARAVAEASAGERFTSLAERLAPPGVK